MKVVQSSTVIATPKELFSRLRRGDTIAKLTKGFPITYDAADIPDTWQLDQKVNLRPRLFGIPQGDHFVEFKRIDEREMLLFTHEYGSSISRWDHTMEIKPLSGRRCQYTDTVIIEAGIKTPLLWLLAKLLYRHRHKQLPALLRE